MRAQPQDDALQRSIVFNWSYKMGLHNVRLHSYWAIPAVSGPSFSQDTAVKNSFSNWEWSFSTLPGSLTEGNGVIKG